MIELIDDTLSISFPDEHPEASMRITLHRTLHRTLRLPDDGTRTLCRLAWPASLSSTSTTTPNDCPSPGGVAEE